MDIGISREGHLCTASAQTCSLFCHLKLKRLQRNRPSISPKEPGGGKQGYWHPPSRQVNFADIFTPNLNSSFSPQPSRRGESQCPYSAESPHAQRGSTVVLSPIPCPLGGNRLYLDENFSATDKDH